MRAIAAVVAALFVAVGLAAFLWVSERTVEETPLHEFAETGVPPAYLAGTTSRLMESLITGRTYQVSVALPRTYGESTGTYPVLYAVDANGEFGTVVEAARSLFVDGLVPELIVVGIGYPVGYFFDASPLRPMDLTPTEDVAWRETFAREVPEWPVPSGSGEASEFLRFLRRELIPIIDSEYRTDAGDRALFGHSFGGLFAFYALLHGDGVFNRVIVGSPSLWWDERVSLAYEAAFAETHDSLPAKAFFSVGLLEPDERRRDVPWGGMVSNLRELLENLEEREYEDFNFESHFFDDETHTSVIGPTISRGLRYIYGEQ